jgi:hypothetical protein
MTPDVEAFGKKIKQDNVERIFFQIEKEWRQHLRNHLSMLKTSVCMLMVHEEIAGLWGDKAR